MSLTGSPIVVTPGSCFARTGMTTVRFFAGLAPFTALGGPRRNHWAISLSCMAALEICDLCFEITQHFFKIAFGNGSKFLGQEPHASGIEICNKRFRFSLCQPGTAPAPRIEVL